MRRKNQLSKWMTFAGLIIIVFLMDLPLISMVGTAFKRNQDVLSTTSLFPKLGGWSFENFAGVFTKTSFAGKIGNSILISVASTIVCVIVASMAGYALARYKGTFFKGYSMLLFLMQMFPVMLLLIPMFVLYSRYGMVNKPWTIVIYYAASNLAFNIMMVRSFFETIPIALEEAAKVDGCTDWMVFTKIIIPISLPGIATIGIMTFLNCWNEFTFASLLLRKPEIQTLTVGLSSFVQQSTSNWGYLMAASAIGVVPVLFFLIFAQKYLVQGMTAGAVKG